MGGHRGTAGWDMAGDCQLLQLMYLMYVIINYSVIPGIRGTPRAGKSLEITTRSGTNIYTVME